MMEMIVRDVEFNGAMLKAAQEAEKIIWVGVRWICQGLGLSKGQMQHERKKIQTDEVLAQGERNFVLPTDGGNQETLCLKLDFLPLWLAKIHVTPKMKIENPQLAENLVTYQLKAKDVLASAFLNEEAMTACTPGNNYSQQIATLQETIGKMYKDMKVLANIILDWKDKVGNMPTVINQGVVDKTLEWKLSIYEKMDRISQGNNNFQGRTDVMKYIYKYMTKNYGIVWEQEIREHKEQSKLNYRPSIINVVSSKEMLKSIFESILADMEEKYSEEKEVESVSGWSDGIIAPLAEKYHDRSNAYMITYRKVYRQMDNDYKIGWKNLETRYVNRYGRKSSKKDLIEMSPVMWRRFAASVLKLMEV